MIHLVSSAVTFVNCKISGSPLRAEYQQLACVRHVMYCTCSELPLCLQFLLRSGLDLHALGITALQARGRSLCPRCLSFFSYNLLQIPFVPRTFLISCPCLTAMLTFARFWWSSRHCFQPNQVEQASKASCSWLSGPCRSLGFATGTTCPCFGNP